MKSPEQQPIGMPQKSMEGILQTIGAKGSLLKIGTEDEGGQNEAGEPNENYTPVLDGEELSILYSSYGLGIFKSKDGRFFFGTSHYNNTPQGIIEIDEPSKEDMDALYQGKRNKFDALWGGWNEISGSEK